MMYVEIKKTATIESDPKEYKALVIEELDDVEMVFKIISYSKGKIESSICISKEGIPELVQFLQSIVKTYEE